MMIQSSHTDLYAGYHQMKERIAKVNANSSDEDAKTVMNDLMRLSEETLLEAYMFRALVHEHSEALQKLSQDDRLPFKAQYGSSVLNWALKVIRELYPLGDKK